MKTSDPTQKQAIDAHHALQELSRRAGDLELQLGELDQELKKAREAAGRAEARASESERRAREAGAQGGRVAELEKRVESLRLRLVHESKGSESLRVELDRSTKQIELSERKTKQSQDELQKAQEHVRSLSQEKDRAGSLLINRDIELAKAREEAAGCAARAVDAEGAAQKWKTESSRVPALEEELRILREQLEEVSRAREEMTRELDESRRRLDTNHEGVRQQEGEFQKLQELARAAELEHARLRMQLAVRDAEVRKLREAASASASRTVELESANQQLSAIAERNGSLERELAFLRGQESRAAEAAREMKCELEEARHRFQQSREGLDKLEVELGKSKEIRETTQKENTRLRQQVVDLERKVEQAETRASEAGRYFESLERELMESRESESKARSQAAAAAGLKEAVDNLQGEVKRLERIRQEQQGRLDELGRSAAVQLPRVEGGAAVQGPVEPKASPEGNAPEPPAPSGPPEGTPAAVDGVAGSPLPATVPIPPPAAPLPTVVEPPPPTPPNSAETTLRPQHLFGPPGEDGQPSLVLLEIQVRDALGAVYQAAERSTGRRLSVRFMAGQAGEAQTQAIEREVEKMIALPHPNILHVQASGRRKNRLYLATDLIDAPNLSQSKIREIPRVCAILRDVAAAVHYAHEERIFHGDLNPDNILIGKEGDRDHALVKDFGLAHLFEKVVAASSGGEPSFSIRNPAFLPPEEIRVLKSEIGVSGDVYGLGATLYAALTGRAPFEGKERAKLAKRIMIEEPDPVERMRPDIPKALGAIVRHAMAKERGLRYTSAQELSEALTRFLEAT